MGNQRIREKAQLLLSKVIKECYAAGDEDFTRLKARKTIKAFCDEIDDFELRAITNRMLNEMTFAQIIELYNQEEPEVKNMGKETALFDTVIKGKDGEEVVVYLNGDEDEGLSFKKVKSFRFEEHFYVLLQDLKDNALRYYRYALERQEGKTVEKLLRVNDEQLVSFFKFLGY